MTDFDRNGDVRSGSPVWRDNLVLPVIVAEKKLCLVCGKPLITVGIGGSQWICPIHSTRGAK